MRHGFLLLNKPKGPTSHDVVAIARKALSERKIGHTGTLDPAATGLMVLGVGAKALKLLEFYQGLTKEYEAEITFGKISSTYDADGVVEDFLRKPGVHDPEEVQIRTILEAKFVGNIEQRPPAHSAIRIEGERAYTLARKGDLVEMPFRSVHIDACEILSYAYPVLQLRVSCAAGTYIRSLAHDLGESLRCGAILSALRRTRVGDWTIEEAVEPESIAWSKVIPLKEVALNLPKIDVTEEEANHIRNGRRIQREVKANTIAWAEGLPIAVLEPVKDGSRSAKPRKVL